MLDAVSGGAKIVDAGLLSHARGDDLSNKKFID
jgi:hypothetical protein